MILHDSKGKNALKREKQNYVVMAMASLSTFNRKPVVWHRSHPFLSVLPPKSLITHLKETLWRVKLKCLRNGTQCLHFGLGPRTTTCVERWRIFARKGGFLLQYRTKFGTAGLFWQTEHAKAIDTSCSLHSHHGEHFYSCCVEAKTKCRWEFASKIVLKRKGLVLPRLS